MDGATIIEQLMTTEVRADPYPLYGKARALGPIAPAGDGMFVVSGYEAVNKVLRTPGFGVATAEMMAGTAPELATHSSLALFGRSILQRNAPDQPRVRALIASVFNARRVAALRPAVETAVGRLLDEMAEQGADGSPVDFMDAFAFRLPVGVICELLGVPDQDRYRFRGLTSDLTVALEVLKDLDELGPADAAAEEMTRYFTELAAERLARPQDDLVTDLARIAAEDDGRLSAEELLANLVLLLVGGFETTTNLLGNGLALLFRHPEVAEGLRSGAVSPALFTDEVLRFDSPVQATVRVALEEGLAVDGLPVPPGSTVTVLIGSANHDPARYDRPEVFDPARTDSQPLSFGGGQHFCLGSQLARLEGEIAVPALLDRFPRLAPGGVPTRRDRLVLRGYETLPVTVR
ncbi:cytochrome P450 [Streptomyces rubellomurinus subsp. indigoferus]|uniref:Cytochrome P450 n=1 Tax=Streptomyces rubellomurinus (strain ATCC 31215) TaxID=359131 RepID=A0A0F2TMF1_STRR3|nr:cytochrome P450 [Streptomyces rubellomurinus]KJS53900.1 cytochrome P450 [Streptomyces rubellomurinus subsp. indigoferus]KJS63681.1 cytochrome P450 [Streptomyces rubellomurinus]